MIDVSQPDAPVRISQFYAAAADAVFRPNSDAVQIASVGNDGVIRLWTLEGDPVPGFKSPRAHKTRHPSILGFWEYRIAFSPRGDLIASVGREGIVQLSTLDGEPAAQPIIVRPGTEYRAKVTSIAFSPTGELLATGDEDGNVRLWNLEGHAAAPPFGNDRATIESLAFLPSGDRIVTGSRKGTVRVWRFNRIAAAIWVIDRKPAVTSVAVAPKGDYVAAVDNRGKLHLLPIAGREPSRVVQQDDIPIFGGTVAFSPSGKLIVSTGPARTLKFWNRDLTPAAAPIGNTGLFIRAFAISPDGRRIASGHYPNKIHLWTLENQLKKTEFGEHGVRSLAFSVDGEMLVSGGAKNLVRLWHPDGTLAAKPFVRHQHGITDVGIGPNAEFVVSARKYDKVYTWNMDGTPVAAPFTDTEEGMLSAAVSPTEQLLITGGYVGGSVRFWHFDGTKAREPIKTGRVSVSHVTFSPKGDLIFTSGEDGILRRWRLDGVADGGPYLDGGETHDTGHVGTDGIWVKSMNRVWFADVDGNYRGELRLTQNGFLAITPKGIWATNEYLYSHVLAIETDGTQMTKSYAPPRLKGYDEVRRILLGLAH